MQFSYTSVYVIHTDSNKYVFKTGPTFILWFFILACDSKTQKDFPIKHHLTEREQWQDIKGIFNAEM